MSNYHDERGELEPAKNSRRTVALIIVVAAVDAAFAVVIFGLETSVTVLIWASLFFAVTGMGGFMLFKLLATGSSTLESALKYWSLTWLVMWLFLAAVLQFL